VSKELKIDLVVNTDQVLELAAAINVGKMLSWRGADDGHSILRYDKDTETILVDKQGLLQAIQLLCPRQASRDIQLVDGLIKRG
jgi:hypothetical protein